MLGKIFIFRFSGCFLEGKKEGRKGGEEGREGERGGRGEGGEGGRREEETGDCMAGL